MEYQGIRVRFPAGRKAKSLLYVVQTGFGVHPASYPVGIGDYFLGGGGYGGQGVKLTTYLQVYCGVYTRCQEVTL
jgi:hypothetical protein